METGKSALERAFELAKSGLCNDVNGIKRRLSFEGYAGSQVEGPMLTNQLKALIAEARK